MGVEYETFMGYGFIVEDNLDGVLEALDLTAAFDGDEAREIALNTRLSSLGFPSVQAYLFGNAWTNEQGWGLLARNTRRQFTLQASVRFSPVTEETRDQLRRLRRLLMKAKVGEISNLDWHTMENVF